MPINKAQVISVIDKFKTFQTLGKLKIESDSERIAREKARNDATKTETKQKQNG